jgi:hypothetical protein
MSIKPVISKTKLKDPLAETGGQQLKLSVHDYIDQFGVLGMDEFMNSDNLSQILFTSYITKFTEVLTTEESNYLNGYHDRVFNLVENMRELSKSTISVIFEYLLKKNAYVLDLVIMVWTLPRKNNYLGQDKYKLKYKENIQKYNNKLIQLINTTPIEQFCIESLTRNIVTKTGTCNNYLPIHCIDLLWYYLSPNDFSLEFSSITSKEYVGVEINESFVVDSVDANNEETSDTEYLTQFFSSKNFTSKIKKLEHTTLFINTEYLLYCGLGTVNNINNKNLRDIIVLFMTDINFFNQIRELTSVKNFVSQVETIKKNPKQYFDKDITILDVKHLILSDTKHLTSDTTNNIDNNINTTNNIINTTNNI